MHIHILSPSGHVLPEYIDDSVKRLERYGHVLSIGEHAKGMYGRFSGSIAERVSDLQAAIHNPTIDVILCSRGGYGLAQIVDKIDFSPLGHHPKLLVGFSDITVLHNVWGQHRLPSLHAIMTKHIASLPEDDEAFSRFMEVLDGDGRLPSPISLASHPLNRKGEVSGVLRGGNLSVLYGLRNTPFDLPDDSDTILFIEDVSEHPYHIDRMMQNLRLSGVLSRIKGLVVGQFSECQEDPSMQCSILESIAQAVEEYDYPVCFDFPAGHVDYNLPIMFNTSTHLIVRDNDVTLSYNP